MVDEARRRYPIGEFVQGDIRATGLAPDSCDGIVSWGVIEHDPDGMLPALCEVSRIVKPGGRIVVTVPADHARQRAQVAAEQRSYGDARLGLFQYCFTPGELRDEVEKSGFNPLEVGELAIVSPEMLLPGFYVRFGKSRYVVKALQLLSLLSRPNAENTMMNYCVAEKAQSV